MSPARRRRTTAIEMPIRSRSVNLLHHLALPRPRAALSLKTAPPVSASIYFFHFVGLFMLGFFFQLMSVFINQCQAKAMQGRDNSRI
jgi:hypothetical protein